MTEKVWERLFGLIPKENKITVKIEPRDFCILTTFYYSTKMIPSGKIKRAKAVINLRHPRKNVGIV